MSRHCSSAWVVEKVQLELTAPQNNYIAQELGLGLGPGLGNIVYTNFL